MPRENAEVAVEVVKQGGAAVQVTDGVMKAWVPHSLIDDESEITAESPPGATGVLIIPEWKATEVGLV